MFLNGDNLQARLLVDWDNDGFFNKNIPHGTPLNLQVAPLYTSFSGVRGVRYTTGAYLGTTELDIDDIGFEKLDIWMGRADVTPPEGDPTMGEYIFGGLLDYQKSQPRKGDPVNLVSGSAVFNINYTTDSPATLSNYKVVTDDIPYGEVALQFAPSNSYGGVILGHSTADWNGSTLRSNSADPDFVVSPSTVYTFYIWMKCLKNFDEPDFSISYDLQAFSNTGVANATVLASTGIQPLASKDGWQLKRIQFTTGASTTRVGLAVGLFQTAAFHYVHLAGLMLIQETSTARTRFFDPAVAYTEDQFGMVLAANTAYRAAFYVRSDTGSAVTDITSLILNAYVKFFDGSTDTQIVTNQTFTVTNDWTRVEFAIPTNAKARGLYWEGTTKVGAYATGATNGLGDHVYGNIEFKGFMIWEGTTANIPFSAGAVPAYDNITEDVLGLNYKSGSNNFDNSMPFEGQMDIELNNVDKTYSPSNVDGALYGYLKQNLKVQIEYQHPTTGVWSVGWSGWIDRYSLDAGLYTQRHASIQCYQGIRRLEGGELTTEPKFDQKIGQVIFDIIEYSGWRSAKSPNQTVVGYDNRLGVTTYTQDTNAFFNELAEGVNTLEVVGQDWGRGTRLDKALAQVLDSESAHLWIDRDGGLRVVDRDSWVTARANAVEEINIGTTVESSDYSYGEDITNVVEVKLEPKKTEENVVVWETRSAIQLSRRTQRDILMQPKFEEGREKTVTNYDLTSLVSTIYSQNPVVYDNPTTASADSANIKVLIDGTGRAILRIINLTQRTIWVTASIRGDYLTTGDKQGVLVSDEEGLRAASAYYKDEINSPIINDIEQAKAIGNFRLVRRAIPGGEFKSISFTVASIADYERYLLYKLGAAINITEAQTGESSKTHVIISEEVDISPGVFTAKFGLSRLFETQYALTDVSITASPETNLIEDLTIYPTGGGVVDSDPNPVAPEYPRQQLIFGSGAATFIFGAPSSKFVPIPMWRSYPLFDSTGATSLEPKTKRTTSSNNASNLLYYTQIVYGTNPVNGTKISYGLNFRSPNDAVITNTPLGDALIPVEPDAKYRLFITTVGGSTRIGAGISTAQLRNWTNTGNPTEVIMNSVGSVGETYIEVRARLTSSVVDKIGFITDQVNGFVSLVRWDGLATLISQTVDNYATFWLSLPPYSPSTSYTIEVFGEDGSVIANTNVTPTGIPTKYELNIGHAKKSAFMTIRRNIAASSFTANGEQLFVHAFALTVGQAPDDYTLLSTKNANAALAYI